MRERVEVIIEDAMGFWNDEIGQYLFNPGATMTKTWVFDVPAEWMTPASVLADAGLERVYKYLYGDTWKLGNGDGSAYIVVRSSSRRLDPADPRPAKILG